MDRYIVGTERRKGFHWINDISLSDLIKVVIFSALGYGAYIKLDDRQVSFERELVELQTTTQKMLEQQTTKDAQQDQRTAQDLRDLRNEVREFANQIGGKLDRLSQAVYQEKRRTE